ncbi:hypothetical protein Tco_1023781 [Tanacetum coccineum]
MVMAAKYVVNGVIIGAVFTTDFPWKNLKSPYDMLAGYVMSGGRSMLFLQATSTDWAEMLDNVCGPIVFPHNFGFVATNLALLLSFGCRLNLVLGYLKVLKDVDGWGVIGASDVKLTSFPLQTYVEILRYTRQESQIHYERWSKHAVSTSHVKPFWWLYQFGPAFARGRAVVTKPYELTLLTTLVAVELALWAKNKGSLFAPELVAEVLC